MPGLGKMLPAPAGTARISFREKSVAALLRPLYGAALSRRIVMRKLQPFFSFSVSLVLGLLLGGIAYAACSGPEPLTPAQIHENYQFARKILRESPAEQRKDWSKVKDQYSTVEEFLSVLRDYVSRPERYYQDKMNGYRREYENSCKQPSPQAPECSSNHECLSGRQCLGGKCELIGSPTGDCHYNTCPSGSSCGTDGLCR
jgi:hypothetical protein